MINVKKIETFVKHSYYTKWLAARFLQFACFFNPAFDANRLFKRYFGRKMDLKNPGTLPEKIVWMELYSDTSMWTYCEDKYLMREYVERKGYGNNLPKLYAVWQKAKEIDVSVLPDKFVMKANHGCGDVLVCKDKSKLSVDKIRKDFKRILSLPYGYNNASLHYTRIKPCIIAEELLANDYAYISESMVDFKVWCINGNAKSVLIVYNRDDKTKKYYLDLYDVNWERLDKYFNTAYNFGFDKDSKFQLPPACLQQMLKIAEDLAKGFPQVRVDFYIVDSKPIVGEMTFFTGYGYFTEEYYRLLAEDIELKKKKIV